MTIGMYSKRLYTYLTENFSQPERLNLIDRNDATVPYEVIITGSFQSEDVSKYPNLKILMVPYTGLNEIDMKLVEDRGIKLFNTHAHSKYVAERGLTLTLALLGKLVLYHNGLVQHDWANRFDKSRIQWESLFNKKVGLLGYGHIGKDFHKLIQPFECEVFSIDRGKEYPEDLHLVSTVNELIEQSDILFISLPLTPSTENLIGFNELELMTNKALINVGRGGVIEEEALYNALYKGELLGFASDVWYQYPETSGEKIAPSKYPFETLNNVVMTPHSAGFSRESKWLVFNDIGKVLEMILSGYIDQSINLKDYL